MTLNTRAAAALPLLLLAACAPRAGEPPGPPGAGAGAGAVFSGAGDIGVCGSESDDSTAALLDGTAGIIWTAGDNAYPAGTAHDFAECYGPSWGRLRPRTRPTPGNHEYWTPGARPYFEYFGEAAGEPGKGWYSYHYGSWLIVALNSNFETDPWSEQLRWLRKLLAENPAQCTLAYFHHPLVSSGAHGRNAGDMDDANVLPIWEALYAARADVVLVGHDHDYERFAPMTPHARPDPEHGIRQFVVGTGGAVLRRGGHEQHPLSEVFITGHHGVLRLTLGEEGYAWEFVDVTRRVLDQGQALCH